MLDHLSDPIPTLQGDWTPEDGHSDADSMTLRTALRTSSNRAAVRLLQDVGIPSAVKYARDMGVGDVPSVPSLALGSGEVTLQSLTAAYAAFANHGMVPRAILIRRVEDKDGRVLYESHDSSTRAINDTTAFLMTSMLADVVNAGTGARVRQMGFTLPAAGKTGTTNDFNDAWFVGFTPKLVAGVWVGFDQPHTILPNGFAADIAAPAWAKFMQVATRGDKPEWYPPPPGVTTATVCRLSGKLATEGCNDVEQINSQGAIERRSMIYTDTSCAMPEPPRSAICIHRGQLSAAWRPARRRKKLSESRQARARRLRDRHVRAAEELSRASPPEQPPKEAGILVEGFRDRQRHATKPIPARIGNRQRRTVVSVIRFISKTHICLFERSSATASSSVSAHDRSGASRPPSLIFAAARRQPHRNVVIEKSFGAPVITKDDSSANASPGETIDACGKCKACKRIARGVHPDVLFVEPGDNGSIKIEQVRDIVDRAAYRPFEGRRRAVIIDQADALVPAAQNALLKTLEEPPPSSVFMLITSRPDMLLPTVLSRCPRLQFRALGPHDIAAAWSSAATARRTRAPSPRQPKGAWDGRSKRAPAIWSRPATSRSTCSSRRRRRSRIRGDGSSRRKIFWQRPSPGAPAIASSSRRICVRWRRCCAISNSCQPVRMSAHSPTPTCSPRSSGSPRRMKASAAFARLRRWIGHSGRWSGMPASRSWQTGSCCSCGRSKDLARPDLRGAF